MLFWVQKLDVGLSTDFYPIKKYLIEFKHDIPPSSQKLNFGPSGSTQKETWIEICNKINVFKFNPSL